MDMQQEAERRFTLRTKTGLTNCDSYRELITGQYKLLAWKILEVVPPGREQSLALTHLEESWLYALRQIEHSVII